MTRPHMIGVPADSPRDREAPQTDRFEIKASGWVEVNFLHFPDARPTEPGDVLTPAAFAMDTAARGRDRHRVSARDTRFQLAAKVPTSPGALTTYVEYDLFGAAGSYDARLRRAWLDWTSNDGRWAARIGQEWSLFADTEAYATVYNPLPLGAVFVRQPQLRVQHRTGRGLTLAASLESARGDVTAAGGSLASAPFAAPLDVAMAARLERRWGMLQLGGLIRNRVDPGATGWGVSFSGRLRLRTGPRHGDLRFQTTYGVGIARYIGELGSGFESHFSAARSRAGAPGMERIFAYNLSYERYFAPWISTTIQGSYVHAGPRGDLAPRRDQTAAALVGNIVLHPTGKLDLALEYMRATRRDHPAPAQHRSLVRLAGRFRF